MGWRLASAHWGKGYATEAAQAALDHGFSAHNLDEIVSFTVTANHRSQRVMEKLGMSRREQDDFDHPARPKHDPLCRHVLYRISQRDWAENAKPL